MDETIDRLLIRPLARHIVARLEPTRVTPNQVTLCGAVSGVAAGVFLSWATPPGLLLAATCLAITMVLDCTDGQLARARQTQSELGRVLDGAADISTGIALHLGLWWALLQTTPPPPAGEWFMWVALSGGAMFIHTTVFDYLRQPDDLQQAPPLQSLTKPHLLLRGAVALYLAYGRSQERALRRWLRKASGHEDARPQHALGFLGYTAHNAFFLGLILAACWEPTVLAFYIPGVLIGFNTLCCVVLYTFRSKRA